MSEVSSIHMKSGILPDLNGNYSWGYGGTIPEHITSPQCYNNTARKKSNVRLNDQLIPKPTDINLAEKVIKIATLKEHPYSSHISRFAMFPSFRSPDDPQTGVRAASQPFLNPLIPSSAPDITLLSKTMGGPYRHEILKTPEKTRKKAVTWTGEHGFLNHTKPLKGENQVFYPSPPKTVLPNPRLRDWDLSLSARTSNMLRNLEKAQWVTSYQMHYTGSGPANPLKIDDFKEKMSDFTEINSYTAPLRERSHPVFVPSNPKQGSRRRQGSHAGRSTCNPTAAELLNTARSQSTASATIKQHWPQEIPATHNEAPNSNLMGHSQSECSTGSTETQPSQETLQKQQGLSKSSVYKGRERENCKVQFDERLMRGSMSQSSQETNAALISNTERPLDLHNHPHSQGATEVYREKSLTKLCVEDAPTSKEHFKVGNLPSCSHPAVAKDQTHAELCNELLSGVSSEHEGREPLHSICVPCILPRPPVLPGIHPANRVGTVARADASLLDLQNSFSKSEAHRNFNSSITHAAVNLRDNAVSGKKHDFCGINCNHIHG